MTNPHLTEIVCILDRSGSMHAVRESALEGLNSFIMDQKKLGYSKFTLVMFNTRVEKIYDHVDINGIESIPMSVYNCSGNTALLDAIGKTINEVGARLRDTPEDERPSNVIFAIQTDGEENSSSEFTQPKIAEMIKHQTDKYGWSFAYLSSSPNVYRDACLYSIPSNYTFSYVGTRSGTRGALGSSMSAYTTSVRTGSSGSGTSISSD